MKRAEHEVEVFEIHDVRGILFEEMGLPELDAGSDREVGELASHTVDALEVAACIEERVVDGSFGREEALLVRHQIVGTRSPSAGEVEVLCEGHGGQSYAHGLEAGGAHAPHGCG